MALYPIGDRYPDYKESYFSGSDLKGMAVYSAEGKRVGQVVDLIVNDTGDIDYLAVKLGRWLGKKKQVLLPTQSYAHNSGEDLIYVHTLSKEKISSLPVYDSKLMNDEALIKKELQSYL